MARRNDHSRDQIRSMALEAASYIIVQEGMEGVSARKVAAKIGYTVGTLYHCFDNIQDLILQANGATLSQLLTLLQSEKDSATDPTVSLHKIAQGYLQFAENHFNSWHALFQLKLPENTPTPDWYQTQIDTLFELLEQQLILLNNSKSKREIQLAARVLWGSVHGICSLYLDNKLFSDNIAPTEALIHSMVENYLNSWCTAENPN